ncbi:hypothetical protein ACFXTN_042909 [Malus domestica]
MVATGHCFRTKGVALHVPVRLQNYTFTSDFHLLAVTGCDMVLGVDWLETLGLIGWNFLLRIIEFSVQGTNYRLVGSSTSPALSAPVQPPATTLGESSRRALPHLASLTTTEGSFLPPPACIQSLLTRYQELFQPPSSLPPHREIDHRIPLLPGTGPINVRPYRYGHAQKAELERQVDEMLAQGIICPSMSLFASPALLVAKTDSTWRFCMDYRAINAVTIKDCFPVPIIDELLAELHGAVIFSKLDLRSGYHQICMYEPDIHKTAFRTHEGHYEFTVMPFGLTNASAIFQALMNTILKPLLRKSVLVFFYDILVFSDSLDNHISHLTAVFDILQQNHLRLKPSKCSIGQSSITYLGHIISASGVTVDPSKIAAIVEWPTPSSVRALRGFLGLAGYYRKFVRHFGLIAKPLTDLLKKDSFSWSPATDTAFSTLKVALSTTPVLALPDFTKPFTLECDASNFGIGVVLSQAHHPIEFLSKPLAPKHHSLSVYDKEMLAVVFAVQKWRSYLMGHHFTILTDHQTLKYFLDQRITTPAQQKWLLKLFGYNCTLAYRPGASNATADALSRRPELLSLMGLSQPLFDCVADIQAACATDPHTAEVIVLNTTNYEIYTVKRKGERAHPQT